MESDKRTWGHRIVALQRAFNPLTRVRFSVAPPIFRDRGRMDMQQTLNLSNGGSIPSGPTNAVLA